MTTFWCNIGVATFIALLFETRILQTGQWAGDEHLLFILATIMQLLTICIIPIALRLFKFKKVGARLTAGSEDERAQALRTWGLLRLDLLNFPMLLNILFYYLTDVVGFIYMGIILALCLFFVFPSRQRCMEETNS